jgi:hypothetical protein
MDIITKNLIRNFTQEETFRADIKEDTLFEHFANYCVISKEYSEEFMLEDIHVGAGNDLGIDGIGIVVNGNIVVNIDEIKDLAFSNKYIEAEFIFIQSKTSSNFDGTDISNFLFGVRDVFNSNPRLPRNEKIKTKVELINEIYKRPELFRRGNPLCKLYYVTTGKWQDERYLLSKIDADVTLLKDINIFKDVRFTPVDAAYLQRLYNYAKNSITKTIVFDKKITIPEINGVKESYIGIIPVSELLSIIIDDSGNILRGLFYDNVRDFQGDNEVNGEIEQTVLSSDKELFVLLNNGITVVAENLSKTGEKFTLEDYQVVNGCQTSHVLYNNRTSITQSMYVPIKLIISDNDEIKNKVIKATNRQTQVKNEELAALTDFQKNLERYFSSLPEDYRLFYERRSQQYRSVPGIEKVRIVTISTQIRTFSSMFLDEPHRASRYYGTLLTSVKDKIFLNSHDHIGYYVSSFANYKLESLLRRQQLDTKYRPFRYHILMILRLKIAGKDMPDMKSNKFVRYCQSIKEILWDVTKVLSAFKDACEVLDQIVGDTYVRDDAKNVKLISEIKNHF